MDTPLQIVYDDVDSSPKIETRVREKAAKLEKRYGRIVSCRVTVGQPHRQRQTNQLYQVSIEMEVPAGMVVVNRAKPHAEEHADLWAAIRDAFDAAERQLQSHAGKLRGEVKVHETPPVGRILRLFPEEGYGFVATHDGQEIYFHKNSVVGTRFEDMAEGDPVRLEIVHGESEKGPQASTVRPVGRQLPV